MKTDLVSPPSIELLLGLGDGNLEEICRKCTPEDLITLARGGIDLPMDVLSDRYDTLYQESTLTQLLELKQYGLPIAEEDIVRKYDSNLEALEDLGMKLERVEPDFVDVKTPKGYDCRIGYTDTRMSVHLGEDEIGYINFEITDDEVHIKQIFVDNAVDITGCGYCTAMLEQICEMGKKKNIPRVTLEVESGQKGLQDLYARSGFKPEACSPQDDALFEMMVKYL